MNKATTVRLPESLKVKLKQAAVKRGMTLNNLVIQLLWESVSGLKQPLKGGIWKKYYRN